MASSGADNTTNTTSPCLNCSKACTLRCARCRVVSFCNRECQEKSRKAHKVFCKAVANPERSVRDSASTSTNTCLIVDGLGPCGSNWDYMKRSKQELSLAGVHVCVVNAEKGRHIPEQVASLLAWNEGKEATFRSILILGLGSGDNISHLFYDSPLFREASVSWVQAGGHFLVQGERTAMCGHWPEWFGKTWKDGDYVRTSHTCFARPSGANGEIAHWCKWYHEASGAITKDINVKATMLNNVPADEVLFGTDAGARSYSLVPSMRGQSIEEGMVAVALGKCGQGTVSFFGDVNHEDETVRTIAIVARGY
jgi:hypothetical protein